MVSKQRFLLIELNEFNDNLLRDASKKLKLKNIEKIFDLEKCNTYTHDTYDSDYLEPWVQWVTVHTGCESSEHEIKHLGDISGLKSPQIWETLAKEGVTSGVWGCLNSAFYNDKNCLFYMPDPWTVSQKAYPECLNDLLDLPRYLVTHRMKFSILNMLKPSLKLLRTILKPVLLKSFLKELPKAVWMLVKYKGADFAGFALLEYMSGLLFIEYWKKYKPQFGIFFMNTLAHLQHYYWSDFDYENNERLKYGLSLIDKLYGKILETLDDLDGLAVTNALSQKNTTMEDPWVSYCPKNHKKFLESIGVQFLKVDPLMSYDAFVYFNSEEDCASGYKMLDEATVLDKKLFLIEKYKDQPCKLFYRFMFTDPVNNFVNFKINNKTFKFKKYFKKIITRTGKHIQESNFYVNKAVLKSMHNKDIHNYILEYFNITSEKNMRKKETILLE